MAKLRFLLLCVLGFAGLILLLRLTKPTPVPRPRRFALPQTWHLSGWRRMGGQKVPWEIWGQLYPALSYERLGTSEHWSRGEHEDYLTPKLPGMPARLIKNADPGPNNRLVLLQNWGGPERDPATELPLRYRIQIATATEPTAELGAEYNVPLPKDLPTPKPVLGATLDLLKLLHPEPGQPMHFSGQGVSLALEFLSVDDEGNLRLRVQVRPSDGTPSNTLPFTLLGTRLALQKPFFPPTSPPRLTPPAGGTRVVRPGMPLPGAPRQGGAAGAPTQGGGGVAMGSPDKPIASDSVIEDDQKKNFLLRYLPESSVETGIIFQLTRLTPLAASAPLPKRITLPFYTELAWVSGVKSYFRGESFAIVASHLTLPLPATLARRTQTADERVRSAELRGTYYVGQAHDPSYTPEAQRALKEKANLWLARAGKPTPEPTRSGGDSAPK